MTPIVIYAIACSTMIGLILIGGLINGRRIMREHNLLNQFELPRTQKKFETFEQRTRRAQREAYEKRLRQYEMGRRSFPITIDRA